MTSRRAAVTRPEPLEARARHLLGRSAGVVDVEVLALLEPAHALAVDLAIARLDELGPVAPRVEVLEELRARVARRDRRARR